MVVVSSTFSAPVEGILHQSPATKLLVNGQELGTATLYVTENNVVWGGGVGVNGGTSATLSLLYPNISLHAVQREPSPALFVVLSHELRLPELEQGAGDATSEDDDDEFDADNQPSTNLLFVPASETELQPLYQAMVQGQALHPDPQDLDDDHYEDGEEFDEGPLNSAEDSIKHQTTAPPTILPDTTKESTQDSKTDVEMESVSRDVLKNIPTDHSDHQSHDTIDKTIKVASRSENTKKTNNKEASKGKKARNQPSDNLQDLSAEDMAAKFTPNTPWPEQMERNIALNLQDGLVNITPDNGVKAKVGSKSQKTKKTKKKLAPKSNIVTNLPTDNFNFQDLSLDDMAAKLTPKTPWAEQMERNIASYLQDGLVNITPDQGTIAKVGSKSQKTKKTKKKSALTKLKPSDNFNLQDLSVDDMAAKLTPNAPWAEQMERNIALYLQELIIQDSSNNVITKSKEITKNEELESLSEPSTSKEKNVTETTAMKAKQSGKSRNNIPVGIKDLISRKHSLRRKWQQTRCPTMKRELNRLCDKIKRELYNWDQTMSMK